MTNVHRPDYYLYQDKGQWFKTSPQMTKEITSVSQGFSDGQLPKVVFLPQWEKPTNLSERVLAWRVNEFGEQVVRNYWKQIDHDGRKHNGMNCKPLGGGQCVVRVPCYLEWSEKYERWVLAEMPDKANESDLIRVGI